MSEAVRAEGLEFCYGGRTVLRGVTFSVAPGESVGLAGPNGAARARCCGA